ncbi:hypothetical protein BAU15_05905 [Enterococcus sp. JM4C]|uniref:hypothetical protein n=1 Tax=Candidatus Enterococcus huntleyi TaxID=1857217 RepID=UPI00137B15AF|nr:hypothetical protein [Enterococcus sp. JM4C]KAF1297084.1 hypothetical protein BAU15_05905 [Enterococcus sp. JM4C]
MSEYIYLAGSKPFLTGSIGDNPRKIVGDTIYYDSDVDLESFYFEDNYDVEDDSRYPFSTHFSNYKFQVCSSDLHLPEEGTSRLSQREKKAVNELFSYIHRYFEQDEVNQLEILYSLNSYEDEPLKTKKTIKLSELKMEDLFYKHFKFLTIER